MPQYLVVSVGNRILGFDLNADGNAAPRWIIAGPDTKLGFQHGLDGDLDALNLLFVGLDNAVNSYEIDKLSSALHNLPPKVVLQGPDTLLVTPQPVYHSGFLYSLNNRFFGAQGPNIKGPYITVHPFNATYNTLPLRTLFLSQAGIDNPVKLALVNELLCVADVSNDHVAFFDYNGNGNVMPVKVIKGSLTGLAGVRALASAPSFVGSRFPLYVGCISAHDFQGSYSINVFGPTASDNVRPDRVITSIPQGFGAREEIVDLAVDRVGHVYTLVAYEKVIPGVPPRTVYSIRVYSPTANGETLPIRTIWGDALDGGDHIALMNVSVT